MTIKVESGQSGWGNYVLYGTKEVPRDTDKVEFLEGDIALGDRLCESNNYQESYYRIVLGFEGKPSDEVMKSAYEDFKKEFFVGFKPDEYHIDAVVHKDTDNYHIHIRVPKQNLKTDTHLQLYMDKFDRPRKELIQDYISLKNGFNIARETNKKVFKDENTKIDIINKWRSEHNQKPFDLKSKDGQKHAEKEINTYISELTKSGLVESQNDIKRTLEDLGLKVEKFGTDIKKDFSYVTVSNDSGKMRIKGEIYKDEFWKFNREDRSSQLINNKRIGAEREPNQDRIKEVRRELNKANERRFNKVSELFKSSRARAEQEHTKTFEVGRLESLNSTKHIKSNIRAIDRNTNAKTTNEVGAVHTREKLYSNRQKQLFTIQRNRANLRQEPKSLLLQNKIKDKSNDIIGREIIERIRTQREASETALQRARSERELIQERASRDYKELQNRTNKIADYYDKIRTKVVEKINEAKETLKEKLDKISEKYLHKKAPEKEESPLFEKDERLEKLIEKMEAGTGNQERSSNLKESKELTAREKFERNREVIREQIKEDLKEKKEVPELQKETESTKKRSYQRQR